MKLLVSVIAFASIASATGCKKKAADEGKQTADKATEKAAAPTATACSDKALKHTNPSFCVDLPAGYEASAEKKDVTGAMNIDITRTSDKEVFVLSWGGPVQTADAAIEAIKKPDSAEKIAEQGDMPNGGYLVRTVSNNETTDNKDFYTVYSIAKGSNAHVSCFGMNAKQDFINDVIKVCKALRVD